MRAGDYPYPADEFDAAARAGGPRGAHRAPRSWWSRWWPFVVVLLVFPALAYAGITLLSDWDGLPGGGDQAAQVEPDDTEETGEGTPEETTEEEPTSTEAETPEPPPADFSRPVEVYNSTTITGLASNGADRLEAAGFTAVTSGNWSGEDPASSIVYYGTPDDVTTAQQVAATLGIVTVTESAELAPAGIVAVLAADYVVT